MKDFAKVNGMHAPIVVRMITARWQRGIWYLWYGHMAHLSHNTAAQLCLFNISQSKDRVNPLRWWGVGCVHLTGKGVRGAAPLALYIGSADLCTGFALYKR
ncbi:MAG: hypothetical protein Fur005_44590 [Roseiflexaceae bacterium]